MYTIVYIVYIYEYTLNEMAKKQFSKRILINHNCFSTDIICIFPINIKFWLILPVVICLSQRLSHACLSTYSSKVKPQKAQYISYGLLDRVHSYLDNCGNSRANTCKLLRTVRFVCFY